MKHKNIHFVHDIRVLYQYMYIHNDKQAYDNIQYLSFQCGKAFLNHFFQPLKCTVNYYDLPYYVRAQQNFSVILASQPRTNLFPYIPSSPRPLVGQQFYILHMSGLCVIYLSLCAWNISLIQSSSASSKLPQMTGFHFFTWLNNTLLYICIHFKKHFISWQAIRLVPFLLL